MQIQLSEEDQEAVLYVVQAYANARQVLAKAQKQAVAAEKRVQSIVGAMRVKYGAPEEFVLQDVTRGFEPVPEVEANGQTPN